MSRVIIKLADFFRGKANDESKAEGQEGQSGSGESADGKDGGDGDGDSDKQEEGESGESAPKDKGNGEGESTEGDAGGEDGGDAQVIEMTASDFNTMKANAATYVQIKAEHETLKAWKASMDGLGTGMAKEDQTTRNGKKGPSVFDASWNQAAIDAAAKVK